ncbi:MAG TPA: amidohydrolase family protein [Puia sp.]|nr:amidohydrolase family protein [Puia sp.]
MKTIVFSFFFTCCLTTLTFSQKKFSNETKKFIQYNDSVTVFKNALLIDGKGDSAKPHQTVIISNGKISWIGNASAANIPKNANIIDLNGKALMPGFVMLHEHMFISANAESETTGYYPNLRQLAVTFPRLYLASGATTIRTCGSIEPYSDLRLKKDIDSGIIPGPSLELTAPYIEGNSAVFPQMKENKTPEEAAAFVNYWADQGFTSFKAYMGIDKKTLKAAIDAAHKRKLKITGHIGAVTYKEAADLGIDNLEHGFFVSTDFVRNKKENTAPSFLTSLQSLANLNIKSDTVKQFLQYLIDKKVGVTSTLAVLSSEFNLSTPSEEALDAMSPDTRNYYLTNSVLFSVPKEFEKTVADYWANGTKMEKMFYDMGGLLEVGTDPTGNGGTLAGYGDWDAIKLLVKADGFTPLQAIKIATLNGAIGLGLDKTIGTIDIGKSADLLIVDGDPSKNINDIQKVVTVFKNGVGYNSKLLFESVKGKVGFY